MPRLDFYINYELQATFNLIDDEVLIGRDRKCTVTMPSQKVSRVHAVIRTQGDNHLIENISKKGTKVNGKKIDEPHKLRPGDAIFISKHILIYQSDDALVSDDLSTILD